MTRGPGCRPTKEKIPAIRAWLIEACHAHGTVTYSDIVQRFALTFYPLRNAMSRLGHECKEAGEPVLTALIVDKDTSRCSQGLGDEFQIDEAQLATLYAQVSTGTLEMEESL